MFAINDLLLFNCHRPDERGQYSIKLIPGCPFPAKDKHCHHFEMLVHILNYELDSRYRGD